MGWCLSWFSYVFKPAQAAPLLRLLVHGDALLMGFMSSGAGHAIFFFRLTLSMSSSSTFAMKVVTTCIRISGNCWLVLICLKSLANSSKISPERSLISCVLDPHIATDLMDESSFALRLKPLPESSGISHCCTSTESLNLPKSCQIQLPLVEDRPPTVPRMSLRFHGVHFLLRFRLLPSSCLDSG